MVKITKYIGLLAIMLLTLTGCSKVSPTGLLIAASNVDERFEQAQYWFNRDEKDYKNGDKYSIYAEEGDYSFLLGSDPHIADSLTRITEFFEESIKPSEADKTKPKYLFSAILGDIVDTKAEFYSTVNLLMKYYSNIYDESFDTKVHDYQFRLFSVVGNHDITHNGWAMFYDIFGMSTYAVVVLVKDKNGDLNYDLHMFLDSANGTMGKHQYDEFIIPILEMAVNDDLNKYVLNFLNLENLPKIKTRHKFVYTHNPFFRSRLDGLSSNYPREEYYRLLDTFSNYKVDYVFAGHLHAPGYQEWRGLKYVLLDAFGERNRPEYGEVCNVTCKMDGTISLNYIHMK